jgi:hypothetical protein
MFSPRFLVNFVAFHPSSRAVTVEGHVDTLGLSAPRDRFHAFRLVTIHAPPLSLTPSPVA